MPVYEAGGGKPTQATTAVEVALRAKIKELIAEADGAQQDGDEITASECMARANGVVDALAIIEAQR